MFGDEGGEINAPAIFKSAVPKGGFGIEIPVKSPQMNQEVEWKLERCWSKKVMTDWRSSSGEQYTEDRRKVELEVVTAMVVMNLLVRVG